MSLSAANNINRGLFIWGFASNFRYHGYDDVDERVVSTNDSLWLFAGRSSSGKGWMTTPRRLLINGIFQLGERL
jgi:hypothetical protein